MIASSVFVFVALVVLSKDFLAVVRQEDVLPADASAPRPTLAIVTCYAGDSQYLQSLTWENKRMYAAAHQYEIVDATALANRLSLSPTTQLFAKIAILIQILPHYEWVFWSDADALFLNHSAPLLTHLDARFDAIIPAGPPWNKRWRYVFNTGHMFLRKRQWVLEMLHDVWALRGSYCNRTVNDSVVFNQWLDVCEQDVCEPGTVCHPQRCCVMGEQSAMMVVLARRAQWRQRVKLVGLRDFNSLFPFWDQVSERTRCS